MTAKEFVKQKHPHARIDRIKGQAIVWDECDRSIVAQAKTEPAAWSLAKKLILEQEKMNKHL